MLGRGEVHEWCSALALLLSNLSTWGQGNNSARAVGSG